jgi:uncharacterized protein (DUF2141 family)
MYFLRHFFLVILGAGLVFGCAQVGEISGGEKDVYAPKIIRKNSTPDSLLNFTGSSIKLSFDEFFELKNPEQSIIILPQHAKLKTIVKQKDLTVFWEDTLKENTTYVIYINNAVKDINEGNDSLYKMVFSTGNYIDSLTHTVEVKDAWSQQPVANCTVALYNSNDSTTPTYFAKTNANGIATFGYLRGGWYKLLGFQDENSDLRIQSSEKVAFLQDSLHIKLDTTAQITTLRLFNQEPKKQINYTFQGPERLTIAANFDLDTFELSIDDKIIDRSLLMRYSNDSCAVFIKNSSSNELKVQMNALEIQDTNTIRVLEKEKLAHLKPKPMIDLNQLGMGSSIGFDVNAIITSVDTSKLFITDENQQIIPYQLTTDKNQLFLTLQNTVPTKGQIRFKENAIENTSSSLQDSIQFNFEIKSADAFGKILVDGNNINGNVLVFLFQNEKQKAVMLLDTNGTCTFNKLIPGAYTLCYVLDENNNGKWDTGNLSEKRQPEKIYWYPGVVKVRRNWDLELVLSQKFNDE